MGSYYGQYPECCKNPGLLDYIVNVKFGKSPDDLATREDRWRCDSDLRTSQFFLSDRANYNASLGLVFMGMKGLRHGVTISTRIACRD